MSVEFKDYYKTLGVERTVSQDELAKAYKKLARKYHPDINRAAGAEEKFKDVGEAYQVLKDPTKRAQYDGLGSSWSPGQPFSGFKGGQGSSGGQGFGGAQGPGIGDFSDFFNAMFGGGGAQGFHQNGGPGPFSGVQIPRRGNDLEAEVHVTLEEVYRGTQKEVSIRVRETDKAGRATDNVRSLKVTIPPGTQEGKVLRLSGQGGNGQNGGERGDLRLKVKIDADKRFTVSGHDLTVQIVIAPWEAALGGTADVATLDGEVVVKIPAGIQGGQKLRLRDRGLPAGGDKRGSLFVKMTIGTPKNLSDEERTLYESLAQVSDYQPRSDRKGR